MRSYLWCVAAVPLAFSSVTAFGAVITKNIMVDTFIDSSNPTFGYGADQKLKAVTNGGSGMFPTPSLTHALFTLPADLWAAYDQGILVSATVNIYPFNNSLKNVDGHNNVELHPLTTSFTVGLGTQTPLVPDVTSASWLTSNGTTPWIAAGGDYDLANFVLAQGNVLLIPSKGSTPFTWDITSLINNSITRAELRNNGALLKVTNETPETGNDFLSMYSSETVNDAPHLPYISFVTVPEPASAALILGGTLSLLLRKRRAPAKN